MSRDKAVAPPVWAGLAACMAVGPFMLYALSAAAPLVVADLNLTRPQFGLIATTTFVAAAAASIGIAGLAHGASARSMAVITAGGSIVGMLVVTAAPTLTVVLVGAVICGAAQAASNPATNTVVAHHPVQVRGALTGWKQSGVQMSQLVASIVVPLTAVWFSWRVGLAWGVVIGLVGLLTASRMSAAQVRVATPHAAAARRPAGVWILTAYAFALGLGLAATNTYLPLFAHDVVDLSVQAAGATAALVGALGLISRIWWGRHRVAPHRIGPLLAGLAGAAALGVATCAAAAWAGPALVWLGASIFGASALAANSITMVALIDLVPPAAIGSASGAVATGLYLGFAGGPLTFGAVLGWFGAFTASWIAVAASFCAAAALSLLGRRMLAGTSRDGADTSPYLERKVRPGC